MSKYKRIYVDNITHKKLKKMAIDADKPLTDYMRDIAKVPKKKKGGLFDDIGF